MVQEIFVFFTIFTDQYQAVAGYIDTIFIITGFAFAMHAFANVCGLIRKAMAHTVIKNVQRAFP